MRWNYNIFIQIDEYTSSTLEPTLQWGVIISIFHTIEVKTCNKNSIYWCFMPNYTLQPSLFPIGYQSEILTPIGPLWQLKYKFTDWWKPIGKDVIPVQRILLECRDFSNTVLLCLNHDDGTIKTHNPKCRFYWCLIEFIYWRYSQSCWYSRPLLWNVAPLPSLWTPPPFPPFQSKCTVQKVCACGGGGWWLVL